MGILSYWREKNEKRKRLEQAADQLWYHIQRGANLEVPLHLKKDDEFIQAIAIVQRRHPKVKMRFYQSKGLVLGLHQPGVTMDASPDAMAALNRGGYFGQEGELPVEAMLAQHETWLRARGLDPLEAEAESQAAVAARHRIEVGGFDVEDPAKTEEPVPTSTPVPAPAPTPTLLDASGNPVKT
jgi:hypothetical protein